MFGHLINAREKKRDENQNDEKNKIIKIRAETNKKEHNNEWHNYITINHQRHYFKRK